MARPQAVTTIPGVVRDGKEEIDNNNAEPQNGLAAPGALAEEQPEPRKYEQQEWREYEQSAIGSKGGLPECIKVGEGKAKKTLGLPGTEDLWPGQIGIALTEGTAKAERIVHRSNAQRWEHSPSKQQHRAPVARMVERIKRQAANDQSSGIFRDNGIPGEQTSSKIMPAGNFALLNREKQVKG